jgi:D-alanine--poly(phosphoribitol) ligase subunit 1
VRFDLSSNEFVEADTAPTRLAVDDGHTSLNWGDFQVAVMRWLERARAYGIAKDVAVVVHGHKEAAFFVAMAGCLCAGSPFVPVDASYPTERFDRIKRLSGAALCYDAEADQFAVLDLDQRPKPVQRDLAYIMFTSGSTGVPKGVQIGRESILALAEWMRAGFGLGNAPVFMNQALFSFDLSMYEVIGTLAMGGSCVLNSGEVVKNSDRFMERQRRLGTTVWVSTPSFAHRQLTDDRFNTGYLPELRTFLFCGEPLAHITARHLREKFPASRILNTYGPTEATVATTSIEVNDDLLARYNPLPVGYCKPEARIFLDSHTGEICIAGRHVMRGYLDDSANAGKLFEHDGQRAFRTGDLGEIDSTGLVFCRGRLDDQVKLNGFRVELGEVDSALRRLDGVANAATIALRRPNGTVGRLVGFIVPAPGVSAENERAFLDGRKTALAALLPFYMLPSELLICGELPLSANYKIDRGQLLRRYQSGP